MKLNLAHNWLAKLLSLLLATAIWFLIKDHLVSSPEPFKKKLNHQVIEEEFNYLPGLKNDKR
jgi:hypothetical protein